MKERGGSACKSPDAEDIAAFEEALNDHLNVDALSVKASKFSASLSENILSPINP